jgi:two-component system, chemotaxis family, chemotaxis protein CheY
MAKILIVDDSAMSRRIMKDILEGAGHDVVEADDGLAALETYFLQKPDIVMLDLIMRGMYGLDVLHKLREMDPSVRVIVATADIQTSTLKMAEAAGGVGFVTKPFTRESVIEVVRKVLDGGVNASN